MDKSWNDPSLLFILFIYFFIYFFLNIQNCQFCWKNWLVNEFQTTMGGGIARDIKKKIISIFKTWQKMVTKFGQFKKLKCSNFVNCPNFVTIFCCVLKMKIIFFYIPSYSPPIAVRNSLTNNFFQNNWRFCIFSKKKNAKLKRREGSFQLLKLSKLCYHFLKVLKMEIIFFDISSNPPPIVVRNSLTNQFFQKN